MSRSAVEPGSTRPAAPRRVEPTTSRPASSASLSSCSARAALVAASHDNDRGAFGLQLAPGRLEGVRGVDDEILVVLPRCGAVVRSGGEAEAMMSGPP